MSDKKRDGLLGRLMAKLTGRVSPAPDTAEPAASETSVPPAAANETGAQGPFTVVRVSGLRAFEKLKSLQAQGKGYPVLVGTQEDLDRLMEGYEFGAKRAPDPGALEAPDLDPVQWLRERAEEEPEYYEEMHGDWPGAPVPSNQFTGHCDIRTRKPHREVCILLLPVEHSWQVPLALHYGGWNECPGSLAHASVLRMWEREYGARIVTVSHDTIEMSVERPPATREAAMALARQQYVYCADIVQQGTESIEALAAGLLNGHAWFFWWD